MNLVTTRRALRRFKGNGVFRCRSRSRSSSDLGGLTHLAPNLPAAAPAAAKSKDPRWVLLNRRNCRRNKKVADAKTMAESRTSRGRHLRVSFDLAPPPASSFLCYDYEGTDADDVDEHAINVVAAHGDSILLMVNRGRRNASSMVTYDHFVYRAGAGWPPSLTLLPARNFPKYYEKWAQGFVDPYSRVLLEENTGVLRRRGDDGELLVAQLEVTSSEDTGAGQDVADLCVLRLGRTQWEHHRSVPIIVHEEEGDDHQIRDPPDMAIPVGDRFLCWVCYHRGLIVGDMAEEEASPKLQYVPLPMAPYDPSYYTDDLLPLIDTQNVGAAGDSAVRFVNIEPRCCCGGFGRSSCARSRFAFTVTTWTLTLTMGEPMKWVKDGVLDCEELWALPGYDQGLPRVHLKCPVVSLDNPDAVCFTISNYCKIEGKKKVWMIQVDMRRKALLSVVEYSSGDPWKTHSHIPAKLQF